MNEPPVSTSRLVRTSATAPEIAIIGVLGGTDSLFFAESPGRMLRDQYPPSLRLYKDPLIGNFRYVSRPWGGAVHYLLQGFDKLPHPRSIAVYGIIADDNKLRPLMKYLDQTVDYNLLVVTGERSPHYIGAVNEFGERYWSQRYISQGVAAPRYSESLPHDDWQSSRVIIISTQAVETLAGVLRITPRQNAIVQLHENEILRLADNPTLCRDLVDLIAERACVVSMNLPRA